MSALCAFNTEAHAGVEEVQRRQEVHRSPEGERNPEERDDDSQSHVSATGIWEASDPLGSGRLAFGERKGGEDYGRRTWQKLLGVKNKDKEKDLESLEGQGEGAEGFEGQGEGAGESRAGLRLGECRFGPDGQGEGLHEAHHGDEVRQCHPGQDREEDPIRQDVFRDEGARVKDLQVPSGHHE